MKYITYEETQNCKENIKVKSNVTENKQLESE